MIQFDDQIFQTGWFNHQLDKHVLKFESNGVRLKFERNCLEMGVIYNLEFVEKKYGATRGYSSQLTVGHFFG